MILGFFFLFHFLEVLSGREGFFAKKEESLLLGIRKTVFEK